MAHWLDKAVFYEIYPQSFMDSNADGIGDFKGIQKRLSYIQELGCSAIWMNPCFDSSFYDAGYDVRDYYQTAERYGTNEDLHELFDEIHARGMHILLDLVPGHTAIDNPWFTQSSKDEQNPYTDRYIWRSFSGERNKSYGSIAGFISGFSERPAMAGYNCFTSQPSLNYGFGNVTEPWQFAADSPEAEETRLLLQDIMSFWLNLGCDGFRVDMAASLVKEDEDKKYTIALWQKIRAFLDKNYPDAVLISEWGDPYQALEAGFHMDFLLHTGPTHYMDLFRNTPYFSASSDGDLTAFVSHYKAMYEKTKNEGLICIPSGNHDMVRMRDTLTPGEMKLAFCFLMTMPGCPFVYYGDEIGMAYQHGLKSKEGGYERTGSRTPMQWNTKVNAGFSFAAPSKLYLPIDTADDRPNVESQKKDPDSLLQHVKRLIHFRADHPALNSNAGFRFLTDGKGYPLAYERSCETERLIIVLNPSAGSVIWKLPENAVSPKLIFSHNDVELISGGQVRLAAGSYGIFSLDTGMPAKQLDLSAFDRTVKLKNLQVKGLLAMQNGRIIGEYRPVPEEDQNQYSVTKSFTSTAAGFAVADGLFSMDDYVIDYFNDDFPDNPSPLLQHMQVKHLATMTMGFAKPMLMGDSRPHLRETEHDWVRWCFRQPMVYEPGSTFLYNNAGPYLLGILIQKRTGKGLGDYLYEKLFSKIGMAMPKFEKDPQGFDFGAGGLITRVSQIIKLGEFYLNRGAWNGEQLLPSSWIDTVSSPFIEANGDGDEEVGHHYGYLFWTMPDGMYRADGMYEQYIVIVPKKNAVIAVNSNQREGYREVLHAIVRDIVSRL